MENREAIEILKRLQAPEPWEPQLNSIAYGALDMAISALEKQEGKRPIDRRCPNCKSDNVEVWQDGGYGTTKFNFCPDCGQRIDWGDEHGTD